MRQSFYLLLLLLFLGCAGDTPPSVSYENKPKMEPTFEASQGSKSLIVSVDKASASDISKIEETTSVIPPKVKKPKPKKPKSTKSTKPKIHPKRPQVKEVVSTSNSKMIIGSVEPVRVIPGDRVISARIDTGAKTTSLNAIDMQTFERDGREFVRFRLGKDEKAPFIDKPIWKRVKIKRHGEKAQVRPVVKLRLILGDSDQVVMVTLADRGKFKYELLIGRNFLRDSYVVDVAKKNTTKPKAYTK